MTKVYYVEPVGGHLGMHYYDFEFCQELKKKGIEIVLQTCDETQINSKPFNFEVRFPFKKIYGERPKLARGFRYVLGLLKIIWQAKYNKIHIIHFHFFHVPPLDFLALRLIRSLNIRIVITAHDVIPFDVQLLEMPWIKRLYKTADRIVVHTKDSYRVLIKTFGIPPQKAEIIPQGPYIKFSEQKKISREEARSSLGLQPRAFIILFFGQIKKVKGLDYLIPAFRKVLDKIPDSLLVIAGPEWKDSFEKYDNSIKKFGMEDKVIAHVKYIPNEEVRIYFSAADVVALPYTQVFQSAVLFMAHSFAKPIVASNIGGLAEVIKDGETGILVPPEDVEALAQALIKVFQDPNRAKDMGEKGKKIASEKYSWSSIAEKMTRLYRSLCRQNN